MGNSFVSNGTFDVLQTAAKNQGMTNVHLSNVERALCFGRGEKIPTPKVSALLRKRPVLLQANFVLTKDRKRPYYGHFCGKIHREGSCSKAAGCP